MGKSAKKKPRSTKANPKAEEQQEEEPKFDSPIVLSSDDEADDDLSLKIVEKAMLRSHNGDTNSNPASYTLEPEVIITEVKKKIIKKKERKGEKMGAQGNAVETIETNEEGGDPKEPENLEVNPLEKSDNIVLRKLLRGPRYFDPQDSSWGNCYNCGEGGHTAANCTSAKRKKPCFVCGSFDHNVKQCKQGKDCFICKKGGHRAKDCPEKSIGGSQKAKICLKCGDSGHEMFSCKSIYSPGDLKEIQCYVCKHLGHLCCNNYASSGPIAVSCYKCGRSGHTGLECGRVRAETSNTGTPSFCYRCGEEGHMARKCASSSSKKDNKRKSEFSNSKRSHSRDNNYGNHMGARSVPHKRNKMQQGSLCHQSKARGGWITEDPGYYEYNGNGWGSPRTPSRYKSNDRYHGGSAYNSGFRSNNGYQQRFGNSSSYGKRSYGWDY